jgi:hypothetical protein
VLTVKRTLFLLVLVLAQAWAAPPRITPEGVVFCYYAPEAKLVTLPASFNNWDPGALPMTKQPDGNWCVTVKLAPGVYQYKYFVDGAWKEDPDALETTDDGYGGRNGVIRVPGEEATASYEAGPPRLVEGKVLFTYHAPQARSVSLRGSFNGWGETPMYKGANGVWYILLDLPPGRHQYKYYVDGVWTEDPNALDTTDDGFGGKNAVVELVRENGVLKIKSGAQGLGLKGFLHGRIDVEGLKVQEGQAFLHLTYQAEDLHLAFSLAGQSGGGLLFQSGRIGTRYQDLNLAMGFNAPLFSRPFLSYVDSFGVGLTTLGLSTRAGEYDLGLYFGAVPGQNAYVLGSLGGKLEGFSLFVDAVFATGGWHLPSGATGGGAFLALNLPQFGALQPTLNLGATFGQSVTGFTAGQGLGARLALSYKEKDLEAELYLASTLGDFSLDLAGSEPTGFGLSRLFFRNQSLFVLEGPRNGFVGLKEARLQLLYRALEPAPFLRLSTDYQTLAAQVGFQGQVLGFSGEAGLAWNNGLGLYAQGQRKIGLGTLYLGLEVPADLTPRLTLAGLVPF